MRDPMTLAAPAKPELKAHELVTRLGGIADVARELVGAVGQTTVAELAGVGETRAVREWCAGERAPKSREVEDRLRLALQIVYMLRPFDSTTTITAWFNGMNPNLEDRAPVEVLAEAHSREDLRQVLAAAKGFIVRG